MGHIFRNFLLSIFPVLFFSFFAASVSVAEELKVVENDKVCMVTNMLFKKKQIPVTYQGKTYYGCCENCKETLSKDEKARKTIDPVSGKPVDKATAVIAAREDDSVVYFESRKTLEQFKKWPSEKQSRVQQ